jgi:hypothetical protein
MQVPALIRAGVARGQAGMVGKGQNLWPNVHISDSEGGGFWHAVHGVLISGVVASAIATVFEGAIAGKTATGREGYYFGGEYSVLDAKAL